MAANLHGEQAEAACRFWKLLLTTQEPVRGSQEQMTFNLSGWFYSIKVKTKPYIWGSMVGRCKPLHSRLHWATGAHELESPQLGTDGRFSWSYTVHLITLGETKQWQLGAGLHLLFEKQAHHLHDCQEKHCRLFQTMIPLWLVATNECTLHLLTCMFSNWSLVYWIPD